MKEIAIITDSTAYLEPDFVEKNKITIIPLNLHWGDKTYRDGVNIMPDEFYTMLAASRTLPTTSQPTYGEFEVLFEKLANECGTVIAVLISSGISGTVDSALMAQKHLSSLSIEVIDSKLTSAGLAMVVKALVKARQDGMEAAEMVALANRIVDKTSIFFMVDTLEYLHKGGRIGGASKLLGGALNIKPILHLTKEGKIDSLEKVRTKKKALERLIDLAVEKAGGKKAYAGVIHAQALGEAEKIKDTLAQRMDFAEIGVYDISPVIGTHTGPGALGIAVHTEEY